MSEYANPDALVSTQWVADNLGDPGLAIVEVDVDTTAYESGHIAGAVGWNWQSQLSDNVRRDIVARAEWAELLGESGIGNDTRVVLYGDNNNWFAAFAYWQFKIYGHDNVQLMNGGRIKWEQEGRTLGTDAPDIAPASYNAPDPDLSIRSFQNQVLEALDKDVELVDVRSPAEFTGEIMAPPGLPETAQRTGHIPGAANIPWLEAVNEDGSFKSADDLGQIYGSRGITGDKDIIAYCRIGERSSHTWFVLKELLGYTNVTNYDGSWTEWGSMIGMPIER